MFRKKFTESYLANLSNNYSLFYDDFHEYGNRASAEHAVYFVPGLNGAPGQIRFAMPAIKKLFGNKVYLKSFFLEEFSAALPVWEKYTLKNIEKKAERIYSDLGDLLTQFDKVIVFVSSHGFYDFVNAYSKGLSEYKDKIILFWVACSPMQLKPTSWHSLLYKINGFELNHFEWVAFPNIDLTKFISKESNTKFTWKVGQQHKALFKVDLESRFRCLNSLWFYASIDCFNSCTSHAVREQKFPLDLKAYVLVAKQDGYWGQVTQEGMVQELQRYLITPKILFKNGSHLWVAIPNNVSALVNMAIENHDLII